MTSKVSTRTRVLVLCFLTGGSALAASCARAPGSADPAARSALARRAAALDVLHADARVGGLDRRTFTHEELWRAIEPVVRRSEHLEIERIGESAEGRPLRLVRFGSGPTPVLLWSQMHGDESTASMALADVFSFIAARPEHPVASTILDGLTVHAIPMLNPDGAARFQRRNAQGIDVNRDARMLQTPEGRALKAVRDRVQPRFAFNLHDQSAGIRVGDTDRDVAIALLAPAFDEARSVNDVRADAIRLSGYIRGVLEPLVGGHMARYDDTFNARAFGDLMTRWGSSTVLIESGVWRDDPEKQYLRRVNFVALLAALEAIASDAFDESHSGLYHGLPQNGRRVADLLVQGGTLVVPGLPTLGSDLLIDYEDPLRRQRGSIVDIGDLHGREARDTVDVGGLYVVPMDDALDRRAGAQIQPGAPALFVVARDRAGRDVVWRFDAAPPRDWRWETP